MSTAYAKYSGLGGTGGGSSGVSSVNTLTGDVTLAAGSNITITPSGNTLTFAASGSGLPSPAIIQNPAPAQPPFPTSTIFGVNSASDQTNLSVIFGSTDVSTDIQTSLVNIACGSLTGINNTLGFINGVEIYGGSCASGSVQGGPVLIIAGSSDSAAGAPIVLTPGNSTSGAKGVIQLNDLSGTISAGKVWTATDASGSGHWAAASAAAPNSTVIVNTPSGHGSTATRVRIWSNIKQNTGSDITYASDAVNGDSFTINTTGIYSFTVVDNNTSSTGFIAVIKNATSLQKTQSFSASIPQSQIVGASATSQPILNFTTPSTYVAHLTATDVITLQDDIAVGAALNYTNVWSYFQITRLA